MRWFRWVGRAWTFYRDAFLRGFCARIPLLGMLTLAVALGAGRVGTSFGVPLLFWHKDPGNRRSSASCWRRWSRAFCSSAT